MGYLVFDLETTTRTEYKRKANCFLPENWVVARGWKKQGDAKCQWIYRKVRDRTSQLKIDDDVTLLVGFNIKFDLMWELAQGNKGLVAFFKRGGKIWDCQYAEYLIQGHIQKYQMCSLDSIIESYGGRLKIDQVKMLWEAGVSTEEIDEDLLVDYLVGTEEEGRNSGDIGNTELIFLGQVGKAKSQGQIKMIQDRMDGLLSTTFMEFFGLKVCTKTARENLKELQVELAEKTSELVAYTKDLPWEFNWNSNIQKSAIVFGGTVKYQVRERYKDDTGEWARKQEDATEYLLTNGTTTTVGPTDDTALTYEVFKSGKKMGDYKTRKVKVPGDFKVKWQDRFHKLPGYTQPEKEWKAKTEDGAGEAIYSLDKDVIEVLSTRDIPFLKALTRKMALDKEIGTYYVRFDDKKGPVGMLTCVQRSDHMLHHKLNHTSTVTSRLSSNDPNLQNLPRGDKSKVKAMFVSRFGEDGVMVEADYSQLEVVVQGVLSGDENLCQDLRDKIDFHCKRMAAKHGKSYEECVDWGKNEDHPDYKNGKKERTKCKIFSFQRAYGAGKFTIANETGMTPEEVQELMDAEDVLYPGVVRFNSDVEVAVNRSAVPFQAVDEDTGQWRTYRMGEWYAPTRTRYRWRSWNAPDFMRKRGTEDTFSPPELKNYPVQGTGGEFVQAVLGLLFRRFVETDFYGGKAYLVNTVHDCVWIDCHRDVLEQVCADIKRIMESIPEFYNNRYGMSITVPFPVEVEVGPNMNNLKHWHPGQPAWHHVNDNNEAKEQAA